MNPDHFGPRPYTALELRHIAAMAKRLEDEAVADLYRDLARWERGER